MVNDGVAFRSLRMTSSGPRRQISPHLAEGYKRECDGYAYRPWSDMQHPHKHALKSCLISISTLLFALNCDWRIWSRRDDEFKTKCCYANILELVLRLTFAEELAYLPLNKIRERNAARLDGSLAVSRYIYYSIRSLSSPSRAVCPISFHLCKSRAT